MPEYYIACNDGKMVIYQFSRFSVDFTIPHMEFEKIKEVKMEKVCEKFNDSICKENNTLIKEEKSDDERIEDKVIEVFIEYFS